MFASKTSAARLARAVVGAAALAAFATPAAAAHVREENVPSSYTAYQSMKPTEVMHRIDADQNGYVTREEFLSFQESLFDKIDEDRDRRLGEAEFTDRG